MPGWSSRERIWRSRTNLSTIARESIPGLISLSAARWRPPGAYRPGRRAKKGLLGTWAVDRRKQEMTFGAFLNGAFHDDDALRAWCGARGIPCRGDRPPTDMVDELLRIYRPSEASLGPYSSSVASYFPMAIRSGWKTPAIHALFKLFALRVLVSSRYL